VPAGSHSRGCCSRRRASTGSISRGVSWSGIGGETSKQGAGRGVSRFVWRGITGRTDLTVLQTSLHARSSKRHLGFSNIRCPWGAGH